MSRLNKLIDASKNGDVPTVRRLINRDPTIINNKDRHHETALSHSVIHDHIEVTKLLIENGANVNAFNDVGWTALHWSALRGYDDIAKLLVESGVDTTLMINDGRTALDMARSMKNMGVIRILRAEKARNRRPGPNAAELAQLEDKVAELEDAISAAMEAGTAAGFKATREKREAAKREKEAGARATREKAGARSDGQGGSKAGGAQQAARQN